MKLVYAIVSNEDGEDVILELNKAGYTVTKLSTTGGFLRKGNTTLMSCMEDTEVEKATKIIEKVCGKRRKVEVNLPVEPGYAMGAAGGYYMPTWHSGVKKEVEIGGAVIFATDVSYYQKI